MSERQRYLFPEVGRAAPRERARRDPVRVGRLERGEGQLRGVADELRLLARGAGGDVAEALSAAAVDAKEWADLLLALRNGTLRAAHERRLLCRDRDCRGWLDPTGVCPRCGWRKPR